MKIICKKTDLLKSVNIVMKAVSSKTTMPILGCILIHATTDEIRFTANDMELGIETKTDGIIQEKGMVALDAKLFSEITTGIFAIKPNEHFSAQICFAHVSPHHSRVIAQ